MLKVDKSITEILAHVSNVFINILSNGFPYSQPTNYSFF